MFRRLLLQGLYRVRGKVFGPLHKVGLASHIRRGLVGGYASDMREWKGTCAPSGQGLRVNALKELHHNRVNTFHLHPRTGILAR